MNPFNTDLIGFSTHYNLRKIPRLQNLNCNLKSKQARLLGAKWRLIFYRRWSHNYTYTLFCWIHAARWIWQKGVHATLTERDRANNNLQISFLQNPWSNYYFLKNSHQCVYCLVFCGKQMYWLKSDWAWTIDVFCEYWICININRSWI